MLNLYVKHAGPAHGYDEPMSTMGERIRKLREAHGMTQLDLGKRVGVSKSAVSQWESDSTQNVKLATFLRLCTVLHTDPSYLIYGPGRTDGTEGQAESTRGTRRT